MKVRPLVQQVRPSREYPLDRHCEITYDAKRGVCVLKSIQAVPYETIEIPMNPDKFEKFMKFYRQEMEGAFNRGWDDLADRVTIEITER